MSGPENQPARAGRRLAVLLSALVVLSTVPLARAQLPESCPSLPDRLIRASFGSNPELRQTVALFQPGIRLPDERLARLGEGISLRYSASPGSSHRITQGDLDADGQPDIVEAVFSGLAEARGLLVDGLGLQRPARIEIVLAELGDRIGGYLLPDRNDGELQMLIDATPLAGLDGARRAAMHQYARAVTRALGPGFPSQWNEPLALWVGLELDRVPDACTATLLSRRAALLDHGLSTRRPDLAAGNALWLAFVDQAYGRTALRLTLLELADGGDPITALDRALRRSSEDDLARAFREFQVWNLLVGDLDDGQHYSFASHLETPSFATDGDGLPALSIQAGPGLLGWGATQVKLVPGADTGGVRVHFDGEFTEDWQVDLMLLRDDGVKHRIAVDVTRGSGDRTVPVQGLDQIWLLVRRLVPQDGERRHFSYAAHRERGYPVEMIALEATPQDGAEPSIVVRWETAAEYDVIGFNILRSRLDGGRVVAVNPVWVPALGDSTAGTSYHFLDRSGRLGEVYEYRVQTITRDGLATISDPVTVLQSRPRP